MHYVYVLQESSSIQKASSISKLFIQMVLDDLDHATFHVNFEANPYCSQACWELQLGVLVMPARVTVGMNTG